MATTLRTDWRAMPDRLDPRLDSRRHATEVGGRLETCRVCGGTGLLAPAAPCVDAPECSACAGLGFDWGI